MIVPNPSNHIRRVSLQSTNQNDPSCGPMRVNIPGGPPDAAEEANARKPVAAISPFMRDERPSEVVIHRDRDPRLRNQSTGSSGQSADDILRFPNGQPVRDGPLNTCDSYSSSGGRNQCHIAKGTTCKSFVEKWENREKEMAGIGIGKYPTGDVRDQERGINNNHLDPKPGPSKSRKSKSGKPVPSKPKTLDEALSNFYQELPPLPSPPGGVQKGPSGSLNQNQPNISPELLPLPLPPPRVKKELTNQISRKIPDCKLIPPQELLDPSKSDQPRLDGYCTFHVRRETDPSITYLFKIDKTKIDQTKTEPEQDQSKDRKELGQAQTPAYNQGQSRFPRPRPVGDCFKRSQWRPNTWAPPQPHYFGFPQFRPILNYQPIMRPGTNRPMGWQAQNDPRWHAANGQGQAWYPRHGHPPVRQIGPQRPSQNPHWNNYY